jgi:hypothetical protein
MKQKLQLKIKVKKIFYNGLFANDFFSFAITRNASAART